MIDINNRFLFNHHRSIEEILHIKNISKLVFSDVTIQRGGKECDFNSKKAENNFDISKKFQRWEKSNCSLYGQL